MSRSDSTLTRSPSDPSEWVRLTLACNRRAVRLAIKTTISGVLRGALPVSAFKECLGFSSGALAGIRPAGTLQRILAHWRALLLHAGAPALARSRMTSYCWNRPANIILEPWAVRVLGGSPPVRVEKGSHFFPGEMDDGLFLNMHPREVAGDKAFRWTSRLSAMLVHPSPHATRLVIRTHPFTPALRPEKDIVVCHDGIILKPTALHGSKFIFEARMDRFPRSGPVWLVIASRGFLAPGDPRCLGLPIGEISYHRPSSEK